ncbi:MAG: hypothetical protein M1836_003264 [Candelina mexicana]|nr:MAG: hypothetical protein M1836_003264 [Candelina mexicana]
MLGEWQKTGINPVANGMGAYLIMLPISVSANVECIPKPQRDWLRDQAKQLVESEEGMISGKQANHVQEDEGVDQEISCTGEEAWIRQILKEHAARIER